MHSLLLMLATPAEIKKKSVKPHPMYDIISHTGVLIFPHKLSMHNYYACSVMGQGMKLSQYNVHATTCILHGHTFRHLTAVLAFTPRPTACCTTATQVSCSFHCCQCWAMDSRLFAAVVPATAAVVAAAAHSNGEF